MKGFITAMLCLTAGQGLSQYVQITPTNYSLTITVQNDIGRARAVFQNSTRDTVILSGRVLVLAHITFFHEVPVYGSTWAGPRRTETRLVYRHTGGIYVPVGGESIFVYNEKPGSWQATTNTIPARDMTDLDWTPSQVGCVTTDLGLVRTVVVASPLVCSGRNLAGLQTPMVVRFRCTSGSWTFNYDFPFAGAETKTITLSPIRGASYFTFNLAETSEQPMNP